MSNKYRPSNGTEGEIFMERWCFNCERDRERRQDDGGTCCDIIMLTMAYDVTDSEYPSEWTHDTSGQPICTAFIAEGDELPLPRCTKTVDMFGGCNV